MPLFPTPGQRSDARNAVSQVVQLTYDFRLEDSAEERSRLAAAGGVLLRLAEDGKGPCRPNEARCRD